MCCEDNMGCQAFYLISVKNHHVLANAATTGSSTFSMVLARYDMMRRWNRRNYLERY